MLTITKKLEMVYNTEVKTKYLNITFEDDTMTEESEVLTYELVSLISIWRLKEDLKKYKMIYLAITLFATENVIGYVDLFENEVQYFDNMYSNLLLLEKNSNTFADFKICSAIEYDCVMVCITPPSVRI